MGSVAGMLAQARRSLGLSGRPNYITREYGGRNGADFLRAPWCDMAVTYWARHSDNFAAVNFNRDYAYTVWHAQAFQEHRQWIRGTTDGVNGAKPGDIVFFDWGGTDSIGNIDHVGIVEVALGGGRVQTIEGNTGDACKRRIRYAADIAGFGRPKYSSGSSNWTEDMVKKLPELEKGDTGEHVETLQGLLQARSHPEVKITGTFDAVTEAAVKAVQRWGRVEDDGIVGPKTWPVLLRVH